MERQVAYRTLAAQLRDEIKAGVYDDGRPLLPELQLAERHSLSRQTVRRALQDLVADGSIYRVAGRGTFARSRQDRFISDFGSIEELLTVAPLSRCEIILPLKQRGDAEAARVLGVDRDQIYTMALLRMQGDAVVGYTRIALPAEIKALIEDDISLLGSGESDLSTVIGLIERKRPGIVAATEQSVSARIPPSAVRKHIPAGEQQNVLRVDRVYLTEENRPIELAVNYFDPARYVYRVRLRRETR
jgi:GntR family transcriptional regulator